MTELIVRLRVESILNTFQDSNLFIDFVIQSISMKWMKYNRIYICRNNSVSFFEEKVLSDIHIKIWKKHILSLKRIWKFWICKRALLVASLLCLNFNTVHYASEPVTRTYHKRNNSNMVQKFHFVTKRYSLPKWHKWFDYLRTFWI